MADKVDKVDKVDQHDLVTHLAQGEAAWMLVEGLMLSLIERGLITRDELVSAVENVITTKKQLIQQHQHPQIASVAVGLLSTLGNSLAASRK